MSDDETLEDIFGQHVDKAAWEKTMDEIRATPLTTPAVDVIHLDVPWLMRLMGGRVSSAAAPHTQLTPTGEHMYDETIKSNDENNNTIRLRKQLKKTKTVEDGTVIRFTSGGVYTYAAIFVANAWWITGEVAFFGGRKFTNELFMKDVLGRSGVTNIQLATDWDTV